MLNEKEIEIVVETDGTVKADQIGWEGKSCDNAIDDLLKTIGKNVKSTRKKEWFKNQKVKLEQRWLTSSP